MGYNNWHLPNEAEMDLEHFGPRQVRNYILHAADNIFTQGKGVCLLRKQRVVRPVVNIQECGIMEVVVGESTVRMRKMDNGNWHYVLDGDITQVRVFKSSDIFKMVEGILGLILSEEFSLYLRHHYDCVA